MKLGRGPNHLSHGVIYWIKKLQTEIWYTSIYFPDTRQQPRTAQISLGYNEINFVTGETINVSYIMSSFDRNMFDLIYLKLKIHEIIAV